ncbi:MAG: hypothetical protein RL497_1925 [Pseudomonadota bacterium]|jgi:two-component system sensor histidine kinase BaeS
MKFKLIHKLLLANAGIILSLTMAFVSLSYFISQSLYSNALNGIDSDVLEHLSEELSAQYNKNGSWDFYINDHAKWKKTVDDQFFAVFFSLMKTIDAHTDKKINPSSPDQIENPKWELPFGTFFQRLSLLDANKNPLIEAEILNADASYQKIKLNGKVIGWLRTGKINVDMLPLQQYFFDQQLNIVYWAVIIGGIASTLLSFLLSRHFTFPIRELINGAQQISRRNFKHVIKISTHDELQELAQSFNSISTELEFYQTQQKAWLMDVSHELKAPLTLLVGEIFAICDNLSKCDESTASFLQNEVNHIKRMADDLYHLCEIDRKGLQINRKLIALKPLIENQAKRYQSKFKNNQIILNEHYDAHFIQINGDGDRLTQVLDNIFENSLRYMDSPGELWVRLEQIDGQALLELEDSGPGVPDDLLPKLFDRYYSTSADLRKVSGGAGLGLAICKEIINAHKGEISAISGTRGGLCLRILLPLCLEESHE